MLIHELNVQELPLRFRIFPMPHFVLLGHPSFDPPVVGECAESFYGCVHNLLLCLRLLCRLLRLALSLLSSPLRPIALGAPFLLLTVFLLLGEVPPQNVLGDVN